MLKELLEVLNKYPVGNPRPKWTVLYNISTPESNWIGTGWEFFNDEKTAQKRYDALSKFSEKPNDLGFKYCPTKRPYYSSCDRAHLGAAHAWNKEG